MLITLCQLICAMLPLLSMEYDDRFDGLIEKCNGGSMKNVMEVPWMYILCLVAEQLMIP